MRARENAACFMDFLSSEAPIGSCFSITSQASNSFQANISTHFSTSSSSIWAILFFSGYCINFYHLYIYWFDHNSVSIKNTISFHTLFCSIFQYRFECFDLCVQFCPLYIARIIKSLFFRYLAIKVSWEFLIIVIVFLESFFVIVL